MDEEFDIRRESLKTDQDFERALRPVRFEDFAGQDKIIENLRVFVAAAKLRSTRTMCCSSTRSTA